jgi:creatinine amidohydrolase/Fe(II)-dependent formamide hydrolase-like protein
MPLPPLARALLRAAAALAVSAATAAAQIYHVADLTAPQILALDRAKTVVLLPGGVLEHHGPHLPSGTDGYMNAWWTQQLAEAVAARPGWAVLVFPVVPLGDAGFERLHPAGSFGVRTATLRAVYMDLATELGERGFRWAFVVHNHGAPLHNAALHQAGAYFRDTYGGRMVHLFGLNVPPLPPSAASAGGPTLTTAERAEVGIDVHAGTSETSRMLFLRPDLVDTVYRHLPPLTLRSPGEWPALIRGAQWPGYAGSPRLASAALGAREMRDRAAGRIAVALQILDGLDERPLIPPLARDPTAGDPANGAATRATSAYYAEVERRQRAWLERQGIAP